VTLGVATAVADGSRVTFTLLGRTRTTLTATGTPYEVSLDTRTLPNGRYSLTVTGRGAARRTGRLTIANPAAAPTTTDPVPSTTSAAPTTSTTTPTSTAPTTTASSYAEEVVRLTNVQRVANGCPELTVDATLTAVAQAHSQDMATNDYCDHTSQDGRSPFQRMIDAGYRYSTAAENIAAGYASPAAVVDGWMNSSGHRANILNCSLRQIGVGYATSASSHYRTYWTQDFGTPR
jgi:uncharacterized protein YkwD